MEESVGEAGALYICSRKYEICSTEHKEVSVSLICSHKLSCSFFPVSQRSTRSMPCRNYGAGKLYHEVVILVMNPGIKRSSSKGHWQASKKICLYHRLFCLRGYLSISITHFHLSPFLYTSGDSYIQPSRAYFQIKSCFSWLMVHLFWVVHIHLQNMWTVKTKKKGSLVHKDPATESLGRIRCSPWWWAEIFSIQFMIEVSWFSPPQFKKYDCSNSVCI